MFERFTEHARNVLALAGQEAQRFGHEYVDTEHILWGLAKEVHGVAATVLEHFDVDLKPLRKEVDAYLAKRPHADSIEKLPQSEHAKAVVAYAIEEARALHHNYVGTEHLLLGLLRDGGTVAAAVLANLGLERELVRDEVRKVAGAAHD
jgi:ATP-dependent Clp protease ATP-binding subunit ClpC